MGTVAMIPMRSNELKSMNHANRNPHCALQGSGEVTIEILSPENP